MQSKVICQTTSKANHFQATNLELYLTLSKLRNRKKESNRLDKNNKILYSRKKKKLRQDLGIAENILLLAERIKKKSALGKLYKISVQNISYFNKERCFVISNKKTTYNKTFYWVADVKNNKIFKERFRRQELFATENNFE